MEYIIIKLYVFLIGLIIGSFLNVCIYRIPNNESISMPPSHCMNCKSRLKWRDLVPVLSYLSTGGKCRYCGQKISSRYALVELMTGVLFLTVFDLYGISIKTVYYSVFISILVTITFIDIDHYIIPDKILIFGLLFSLIFNILFKEVKLKQSILGLILSGGGMWIIISIIELIVKKECMGGGDIKLFGVVGFFLGLKGGLLTIILSIYVGAFYGLIIIIYSKIKGKERNSVIPYGPFISVASIISIFFGDSIINYYLYLIG